MTTTPADLRRCVCCGLEKPAEQFRLRRRGFPDRSADCRRCHANAERIRRNRKRARKIGHVARQIVEADDIDQIHRLASRLLEKFGSPRRIAAQYHQITKAALAADPASATAARMLMSVLRLQILGESLAGNKPLPATLEDKRQALNRELSRFVLENPTMIAELLREVGWHCWEHRDPLLLQVETREDARLT